MTSGRLTDAEAWRGYLEALGRHAGIDATGITLPATGFVSLAGMRFRYLDWGPRSAPPLVLLHGGGQCAHTWDAFCLLAARRCRCIALDQRGHGETDWSHDKAYAIADHARDIAAFVDELNLDRPLLVGMSLGGVNAIAYTAQRPEKLRGLVVIDVGPEMQAEPVRRLMGSMSAMWTFDSIDDAADKLSKMGAQRDRSLLRQTLALNMRKTEDGRWTWKFDPYPLFGITTEELLAPRRKLWDVLDRMTCPVLVVRGGDSEVFAQSDAVAFAQRLPNAKLVVVPNARHSVQTDNPRALAEVIEAFETSAG